ncbi:MAG: DUF2442 domain-containing protein [Synergistaceae bacterium]|nr:DUF2442 domain-containing protein [Synergistaceae bacterium]
MNGKGGFFKSVKALPGYTLKIETETGAGIEFDFSSRLDTMRFGALRDLKLFETANTDGYFILFGGAAPVIGISAEDFMDLLMVDRTK